MRRAHAAARRALHAGVAVLALAVLPSAPVAAAELGRCGGFAPGTRNCEFAFGYPNQTLTIGIAVTAPFVGEVRVELDGPTASQSARCTFVAVLGLFAFDCVAETPNGVFLPEQQVTMRGQALGVGSWVVFAETGGSSAAGTTLQGPGSGCVLFPFEQRASGCAGSTR